MEKLKSEAESMYSAYGGEWKGTPTNAFIFPSGAKIYFRSMPFAGDWVNFRGWEIHYLGVDEIMEFEEQQIANLLTWFRSTLPDIKCRFFATGNWEGIGIDWVKRWWMVKCECPDHKGKNPEFQKYVEVGEKKYYTSWKYIFCTKKDSILEEVDPGYEARMITLWGGRESARFKALAKGCSEINKSALFSDFEEKIHTLPQNISIKNNGWSWFVGHDFASSPTGDAFGLILARVNEKRDVIVEDERYGWGNDEIEQTKQYRNMIKENGIEGNRIVNYSGIDIFSNDQVGQIRNIADSFRNQGLIFLPSRIDKMTAASLIRGGLLASINQREGALYIRYKCKRLIMDFKLLLSDRKKLDEWDSNQKLYFDKQSYHFDVFNAFAVMYCGLFTIKINVDNLLISDYIRCNKNELDKIHNVYKNEKEELYTI